MADTPEAQAKGTTYIVMQEIIVPDSTGKDSPAYRPLRSETTPGGDKKAISAALKVLVELGQLDSEEGSFVAVPARSFKVRTRKQETRTLWG